MPDTEPKSLPQVASELWDLTKQYAKQETVDPVKGLARYLGRGISGAFLLGIGVVLALLSLLRALQTGVDLDLGFANLEFDPEFTGNLSWLPYLITLVVGGVLAIVVASRATKKGGGR